MSVDPDEVRALAHAFARTLEHLREYRGVVYVGSAPTPAGDPPAELDADDGETVTLEAQALDHADAAPTSPPARETAPPTSDLVAEPARAPERPRREPPPTAREPRPELEHRGGRPEPRGQQSPPRPRPQSAAPAQQSERNRSSQQSTYSRERPQSPRPANHSGQSRPEPAPPRPDAGARPRGAARDWTAQQKLSYLRERNVGDCQRCLLARTRSNIVFGVGDPEADVMFIGEAPGADEDRLGEPFVGAAGRRLDQWIERLGMRRADVYIANVLKCRPPGNRDPHPVEIERCSPFLHAQIRAIEPKVLIALGRFAGCLLLQREAKLWEMRGKVHRYREPKSGVEIPLIVTYHPAYVLRSEQRPRTPPPGQGRPDRAGAIKSEDEKVLSDLGRAVSLVRGRV